MLKHYFLSVAFTFLFGFVLGMYLYVSGFNSLFSGFGVSEKKETIEASEFVIVGDAYGGCALLDRCPSFQINSDGSYAYLNEGLKKGQLSRSMLSKLASALTPSVLESQSQSAQRNDCDSYVDGVDYTYNITFSGTRYRIDSCGTSVEEESVLWQTLTEIWIYLDSE